MSPYLRPFQATDPIHMNKLSVSRRKVLLGAAVAPLVISSRVWGANSRIRVGQIGCGRIAQGHDMPGVIKSDMADYVAICELDARRLADGVKIIEKSYADRGVKPPQIRTFDNYRELIARKASRLDPIEALRYE